MRKPTGTLIAAVALVATTAGMAVAQPAAPTGLVGQSIGRYAVLDWADNATDEQGYIVERLNAGYWQLRDVLPADATHDATYETPGWYLFRVRAFNADGMSPASNLVFLYGFYGTSQEPPAAPLALDAQASDGGVSLAWTVPDMDGAHSYMVQRLVYGEDQWSNVGYTLARHYPAHAYLDTTAPTGLPLLYRVEAYNQAGVSYSPFAWTQQ